jgi:ferrochelatase
LESALMSQSNVVGVLLMAYGTPDTLANVEPYYTHIRGGRTPAPELVEELRERYRLVGGTTPLLEVTEGTRAALEQRLNEDGETRYRVIKGMKHWHPFIEQAVAQMMEENIHRAVGLVLAPHYSAMSIAGYYKYVDAALERLGTELDMVRIESWHLHPPYLEAVARRVRARLGEFPCDEPVTVVFTAHSLPKKILEEDDPYPKQLRETSQALASMLRLTEWGSLHPPAPPPGPDVAQGLRLGHGGTELQVPAMGEGPHQLCSPGIVSLTTPPAPSPPFVPEHTWTFAYQSAGRTPEPWLGPDLVDKVHELADSGVKNILVASIGFVSDHLEILYDIDYEAQATAKERGVTIKRTEMLNASPDFVEGLAELVREHAGQR